MLRMLGALVAGIAIGAMGVFFLQATSSVEPTVVNTTLPSTKNSVIASNELELLREENAQLKQQMMPQKPVAQTVAGNQTALQTTAVSTANCDAQIKGLMNFYAEKDRTLAELSSIKDPAQYDAKLNAEFMAEPRDEKWSGATETKIERALSTRDEMRDFVLSSIQCRSATCELKIPAANLDTKNKIMTALSSPGALSSMGFGEQYSMKSALESAAGEMIVYISKK